MRLDKFLKVSRIVKRRTVANEMASAGRIDVNGKQAKPGTDVKVGDVLDIGFGQNRTRVRILEIREHVRKEEASSLFEVLPVED
ncbi:MAG: RNA-binding S4 domain-containing protein [Saccharofermentanales bacterium]|jgi:ribosomal 50S subunit-recycling heat shock protein|nr:RNA-binding S4 domain-containing protein [Clostridiaceae bacterium]